jgi:hypothetical protein
VESKFDSKAHIRRGFTNLLTMVVSVLGVIATGLVFGE